MCKICRVGYQIPVFYSFFLKFPIINHNTFCIQQIHPPLTHPKIPPSHHPEIPPPHMYIVYIRRCRYESGCGRPALYINYYETLHECIVL